MEVDAEVDIGVETHWDDFFDAHDNSEASSESDESLLNEREWEDESSETDEDGFDSAEPSTPDRKRARSPSPSDNDPDAITTPKDEPITPTITPKDEPETHSISPKDEPTTHTIDSLTSSQSCSKRPRLCGSRPRSKSPQSTASNSTWNTEKEQDVLPAPKCFRPARPPGHQLNPSSTYTPLDLFKLFIHDDSAMTLCMNTNKQAAKNIANGGKKYTWTNMTIKEFYSYLGLTFFFSRVRLSHIRDHWRKNTIFSQLFPPTVMPRDRYQVISWNIHMSDPAEDAENEKLKGTPAYNRLFRIKPLLNTITQACKAFYHPRKNLYVDERTVATKAHRGRTQHMKARPTKCGFRLFVLADSSNGYTLDFAVYAGKSKFVSGSAGLAYDSVMSLTKNAQLGSGYHVYVDSYHTSPKLFKDLHTLNIGACGTYSRDNRKGFPRVDKNALNKNYPRGTIKWIREDPLLYVKWLDTREVSICSTIHQAFNGDTIQRRVKNEEGVWAAQTIQCPPAVLDYHKHIGGGGVDLSDTLSQYYSAHHRTMRWDRTLFFHFLDIAATNSYLLHKELCTEKQEQPMTHRAFLEELTAQLCGVTVDVVPVACKQSDHVPVPTSVQAETTKRASYGRKSCVHCRKTEKTSRSTPWKCKSCDVALCLIADRNCFEEWHKGME